MMYTLFVSILAVMQATPDTTLPPGTTGSQTTASVSTTSNTWWPRTTSSPSGSPSESPSESPITTAEPTAPPTLTALTGDPSASPSRSPTIGTPAPVYPWDTMPATIVTDKPTATPKPTPSPTYPVTEPTPAPSEPTKAPSQKKDPQPASVVTPEPTVKPTKSPSKAPTEKPKTTKGPTPSPSKAPTSAGAPTPKTMLIQAECTLYEFDTTPCQYGDDHKHSYRHEYFAKAHDLKNKKPICGDRMLKTGKTGWETCGKDSLHPRDLYKNYTCKVVCSTESERYEFVFLDEDDFGTRWSIGMGAIAAVVVYMFM